MGLFSLEEYESAKASFEAAHALEARRETATWIRKCDAELQGAPAAVSARLLAGPREWSRFRAVPAIEAALPRLLNAC